MIKAKNIFYEAGRHYFTLRLQGVSQMFFIDTHFVGNKLRTKNNNILLDIFAKSLMSTSVFETWFYAVVVEDNVDAYNFEEVALPVMHAGYQCLALFTPELAMFVQAEETVVSKKAHESANTLQITNKTSKKSDDMGTVTGRGFNISKHWQKDCSKSNKE